MSYSIWQLQTLQPVFATINLFHPNLILTWKTNDHLSVALIRLQLLDGGGIFKAIANSLAFYNTVIITKVKNFTVQASLGLQNFCKKL
jgi:hypothetical protein